KLREDGFIEADTVARLLIDEKFQQQALGQVIWVDEAGMLSTRQMRDLFRLADQLDARVLLTGDRFQHGSVERGAALRLLEEEAGIRPAAVKEIQRQSDQYREAVKSLSSGDVAQGFATLDELGWVREVDDADRYQTLAADYVAVRNNNETALVISPTLAEGAMISAEIRRRLKEQGTIAQEGREVLRLVPAHFTEAEKTDRLNYRDGDVLQFMQNAKGYTKGDRQVVGSNDLPLDQSQRFAVFHADRLEIAKGDVIRITAGGTTLDGMHRLDNGGIFTVKEFDADGNLVLANGWKIGRDFGHLAHGYTVTSHASQGHTVDRVLIGESSASFAAASREQFYVSVSRGKRQATIYTDDKEALLEAVSLGDDRVTASEFIRGRTTRFEQLQAQRPEATHDQERLVVHER
ncbi:MAG: AAA family ATPase, partial [Pseudomonadales bacterium]|nr:AAA family ATPase [Pseudomonadales bacterium]